MASFLSRSTDMEDGESILPRSYLEFFETNQHMELMKTFRNVGFYKNFSLLFVFFPLSKETSYSIYSIS